mmetsp:Transcript_4759/g.12287  ORF Transcript_4759/g.12287 Transcript_4759/m.12287 type:complete len:230 (+) Transcript_4759:89-778(+)
MARAWIVFLVAAQCVSTTSAQGLLRLIKKTSGGVVGILRDGDDIDEGLWSVRADFDKTVTGCTFRLDGKITAKEGGNSGLHLFGDTKKGVTLEYLDAGKHTIKAVGNVKGGGTTTIEVDFVVDKKGGGGGGGGSGSKDDEDEDEDDDDEETTVVQATADVELIESSQTDDDGSVIWAVFLLDTPRDIFRQIPDLLLVKGRILIVPTTTTPPPPETTSDEDDEEEEEETS